MREPRLAAVGLGLALVLVGVACGGDGARGRLSVVHEDDVGATPWEGAFTSVVVRSREGETLYDDMVVYPGPREVVDGRLSPRRYSLLRDVELPAGPVVLHFDVRACSASCPNRRTAKPDSPQLGPPDGACELELEVTGGEPREVVVLWKGIGLEAKEPCRLAS